MTTTATTPKSSLSSVLIIGTLFFIFGFITWTNGSLIPYLKIACELKTDAESYLVATAFFIAYTVMALPSSVVIAQLGYKKSMSVGLLVMAVGALIFIPAAQSRQFPLFLTGLFVIGTGLALLQTAANPFVSVIGPIESAASRISVMGICNKVAGIIAGIVFGNIALKDADALIEKLKQVDLTTKNEMLTELSNRVVVPYGIIAVALLLLALGVWYSALPDINDQDIQTTDGDVTTTNQPSSIFDFPHLWLGVLALFLYVGVEVIAGDTIISYGKSLGIPLATARYFTQATLACMLVGYIIGIVAIPKYISQQKALVISAVLGLLFSLTAVLLKGYFSVGSIALLGLANSLMWPAIFPLAISGLGKQTKLGGALLIMAIAGGATLPIMYGKLSETIGTQQAYLLMLPCYLYIAYFGAKGYAVKRNKVVIK